MLYKLELSKEEILLLSYCVYAEFGSDNARYIVDGVDCNQLRKKLKEIL